MLERDPLLAVSRLLPDRLKESLLAAHRRAREPIAHSDARLQRLRSIFDADTSLEDTVRGQFFDAVLRSPDPIHTTDALQSVLQTSTDDQPITLAQVLASVHKGIKIIRDGGKGIRKFAEVSESTPSSPLESRQSPEPPSTSSTLASSSGLRITQSGGVGKPGSASARQVTRAKSLGQTAVESLNAASSSRGSGRSSRSGFSKKIHRRKPLRTCEISGYTTPQAKKNTTLEAAHVVPLACVGDHPKNEPMWKLLAMFWTSQDVEDLRAALRKSVNDYGNGLLMKSDVHKLWDDMSFYVEVDWDTVTPEKYSATFQWNGEPDYVTNYWATDGGPNNRHDFKSGDRLRKAKSKQHADGSHSANPSHPDVPLLTEAKITFSTTNAQKCPLPDPYLLLIRSTLIKLSLPNASGFHDEDFEYTDSSVYSCNLTERSSLSDHTAESPKVPDLIDPAKSARLSKKSFERAKLEPPGRKAGTWTGGGSVSVVEDWIANQPVAFEDVPEA